MQQTKIRHTRRQVLALGAGAMLWPRAGQAAGLETVAGEAFGTTWRITAPSGARPELLRPAIDAAFARIDRRMSPWRADSEIGRFNAGAAGMHPVSSETARVAAAACRLAAISDGAFDPTVGPLVAQWGFGPISGGPPDWKGIAAEPERIGKRSGDLTLDLCGIAKGWALDCAMDIARQAGHTDLLMDLGGELAALGRHPSGREWQVAVESPLDDGPAPAVLRLHPGHAVATSGQKAQGYGVGSASYGHIIDPARRQPASDALRSVTVVAATGMEADGWATALFAAGADNGPAMAGSRGVKALFLIAQDGVLQQVPTAGMEAVLL